MIAPIRIRQRKLEQPEKWYVVIAREDNSHYSWAAGVEEHYQSYAQFIEGRGISIVAEQKGLCDEEMDKITGCNNRGEEIGEKHLENLVRRLNNGARIDPKQALKLLYKRICLR